MQAYAKRIRELAPDADLSLAELNDEGLANDVVLLGDRVFRFAKTEQARAGLAAEARVLNHLRGHVSVSIPMPSHVGADVMVYPRVLGDCLDRQVLLALGARERQRLAEQLGMFLAQLHGADIVEGLPATGAPATHEAQLARWKDAREHVYPHLMKHQRRHVDSVFELLRDPFVFDFEPRLIHGDLAPYHMFVCGSELSGVIDFGTAGVGDPANDVACLLQHYGERFIEGIAAAYPEVTSLLPRARFLAQVLELDWIVQGLKSGQPFWFTAHIGTARDLKA